VLDRKAPIFNLNTKLDFQAQASNHFNGSKRQVDYKKMDDPGFILIPEGLVSLFFPFFRLTIQKNCSWIENH